VRESIEEEGEEGKTEDMEAGFLSLATGAHTEDEGVENNGDGDENEAGEHSKSRCTGLDEGGEFMVGMGVVGCPVG